MVDKIIEIILAIFLPPLAVYLRRGLNQDFWIDLILCFLLYFPAILFALYIVLK